MAAPYPPGDPVTQQPGMQMYPPGQGYPYPPPAEGYPPPGQVKAISYKSDLANP